MPRQTGDGAVWITLAPEKDLNSFVVWRYAVLVEGYLLRSILCRLLPLSWTVSVVDHLCLTAATLLPFGQLYIRS